MVTVITKKLRNQSLEDLPSEPLRKTTISSGKRTPLKTEDPERGISYQSSHDRGLGHTRTRSYPAHNLRKLNCRGPLSDSFSMQVAALSTTSNSPPANKKLCRSLSVPEEDVLGAEGRALWVPKASNVWQPVKGLNRIRPESSPVESEKLTPTKRDTSTTLLPNATGLNLISTPPASPTPRPASAFASLDQGLSEGDSSFKGKGQRNNPLTPKHQSVKNKNVDNTCPQLLQRSRSQPCFERVRTCGIKRRIEDEFDLGDKLRPALDLAKMEESSYFRCKDKRRGLRIPKYSNKRDSRGSAAPFFTEQESFILKPIVSSPLDAKVSSIMITPTSSPTKQLDSTASECVTSILNTTNVTADKRVFNLDYDSEIDITSIEEDDFA